MATTVRFALFPPRGGPLEAPGAGQGAADGGGLGSVSGIAVSVSVDVGWLESNGRKGNKMIQHRGFDEHKV